MESLVGSVKYPRTYHLPWSPGATSDDKVLESAGHLVGREVVVTEKVDGECTTIYRGGCHARSLDTAPHSSRDWVRSLAGRVGYELPDGWRVVGENLFAQHSICYSALPSYFLGFGIYEGDPADGGRCLPWSDTEQYLEMLGISRVPVLYRGPWDEVAVRACFTGVSHLGGLQEGYVVRLAGEFPTALHRWSVAKYVRRGHVQTDEHWLSRPVTPNGLARVAPEEARCSCCTRARSSPRYAICGRCRLIQRRWHRAHSVHGKTSKPCTSCGRPRWGSKSTPRERDTGLCYGCSRRFVFLRCARAYFSRRYGAESGRRFVDNVLDPVDLEEDFSSFLTGDADAFAAGGAPGEGRRASEEDWRASEFE